MQLGFTAAQGQMAVDALASSASQALELGGLLDWLMVSLPQDQLPAQFTAGAALTNAGACVCVCERGRERERESE